MRKGAGSAKVSQTTPSRAHAVRPPASTVISDAVEPLGLQQRRLVAQIVFRLKGPRPLAIVEPETRGHVTISPAATQRLKSLRGALRRARSSAASVRNTAELMRLTRGEA